MSLEAMVMRSTGSWYDIKNEKGEILKSRLRGKFKQKNLKVTNPLAVGDFVEYEIENELENTAIITKILARENYIIRKSVHKTKYGHIIAANLDQSLLLVTLVFPRTSLGFIDRFLVSAEAFRIPTIIVFNKADLLDEELIGYYEELKKIYENIGYQCFLLSALNEKNTKDTLQSILANKKTLISGHSGVGKSTLINALIPSLDLATKEVSTFANKGVHTTTFAEMYPIENQENTFIIDTPGIKELGLIDIEKQEIAHYFPEMRALLGQCKFHNCLHFNEPKCAVIEAVKAGEIAFSRYESYLSMLEDYDNRR